MNFTNNHTTDDEQVTHTHTHTQSGTQTHIMHYSLCVWNACVVLLHSAGVGTWAPLVPLASAEVRGYMLRLASKNNTSHSTTSSPMHVVLLLTRTVPAGTAGT